MLDFEPIIFSKKGWEVALPQPVGALVYIYLTNCRCRVGLPIIYIFDGQATSSSSSEEALEQCCGLV